MESRIGKVLSHHQNRGGFSTALNYVPDDEAEQAHGSLYFVVDIGSPSPLAPDIAYNLIDIIKEEFYSDLELSASDSFENALKAANEELEAIYKNGEKDWIGKFNAIVACVHNKDIYVVQRGTAEVHLVRGSQMTNLSRGMYTPGETYRPEETLVNLIEGELEIGDKLMFSTSELFYYISIEKLKRLIENNIPSTAAKKLAGMLEQEEAINRTSVLVAEFSLPELLSTEEDTDPAENWIGEPAKQEPRKPAVAAVFSDRIDKEQSIAEALEHTEEEPVPQIISYQEDDEIIAGEESDWEMEDKESKMGALLSDATAHLDRFKNSINFNDYKGRIQLDPKKVQRVAGQSAKVAGVIGGGLYNASRKGVNFVAKWIQQTKKKPNGNKILLGVLGGVVVLVLITSVSLSRGYSTGVSARNANALIAEANQKRNEAQTALIYQDTAKARTLLGEAYVAATTAASNKNTQAEANELLIVLEKQLDDVNGVKRFNDVQPVGDFAGLSPQLNSGGSTDKQASVAQASVLGGNVYGVDENNNKIYKFQASSGELAIVNSLVSTDKKLRLSAPVSATEILFLTNPANLYSLNLANNSLAGKGLDAGTWHDATKIISYTNKLYFLDPAGNQIWKYQTQGEGYTSVAPYFETAANINISGALDFAIDGSVYVLMPGNTVKKYSGGFENTNFRLADIPAPYPALSNLTALYVDQDSKLYVLDGGNNRVLVFDKEGAYVSQLIYSNIESPSNLSVDEALGFVYLTSGTKIYRLPLK